MGLEACVICVDNSEWMRNGDYLPSRMLAQQDAVGLLCDAKTQQHPESAVGIIAMAGKSVKVLVTPTQDIGRMLKVMHGLAIYGKCDLSASLAVAQLALKHRQNKNQRQRIVLFVGSPILESGDALVKIAKKLKKNNVACDVVNFGEDEENQEKLQAFVTAVNKEENSHLLTIPPGTHILSDALMTSPIINESGSSMGGAVGNISSVSGGGAGGAGAGGGGGGGGGYEFGVDPNIDPELALALRVSMEEETARQQRANAAAGGAASGDAAAGAAASAGTSNDVVMADVPANPFAPSQQPQQQQQQPQQLPPPAATAELNIKGNTAPLPIPADQQQQQQQQQQAQATANQPQQAQDWMDVEQDEDEMMRIALEMSMNEAAGGTTTTTTTQPPPQQQQTQPQQPVQQPQQPPQEDSPFGDEEYLKSVIAGLNVDPDDPRVREMLESLTKQHGNKDDGKKDDKK